MNLTLDLGNTKIKYGIFDKDQLIINGLLTQSDLDPVLANYPIKKVIFSSTRKHLPRWLRSYISSFTTIELSHETKVPIEILYQTPETLGRDRIAAAIGAYKIFPKKINLVIDAGTCITLDVINNKGQFLGGNISPGIWMRIKAMNRFTGKLPMVAFDLPDQLLGKSTESALQNGAVLGTILEIESFIRRVEKSSVRLTLF